MAVAQRRLGHAAAGRFPRWGYLDKFYMNNLMPRAFFLTALLFLAIIAGWSGWERFQEYRRGKKAAHGATTRRKVKVLTAAEIGVPPSLMQTQASAVKVEVKSAPRVAMPVPVPDDQAVEETIATVDEMATASAASTDLGFGFGAGDSLVIDAGDVGLPSPDEYVAFEKAPEMVSMDHPVYPDLAREAGVEGTVLVRVLVGDDGFVKDLFVIQSIPMLDQAAGDAAWTAVFKPALQKDRPVAVWMVIPIEFNLHG
jgi:TonB family protein